MAQAQRGDTVKVHYTGRLQDGTVFDSSESREPLEFTIGGGQMISGFDAGVLGMNLGQSKTITIPAEDAYGPRYVEAEMTVDRSEFPEDMAPEVGDQLQLRQPNGQVVIVVVSEVTEETVTLDANHPLAGKDLTFDIELVEIA